LCTGKAHLIEEYGHLLPEFKDIVVHGRSVGCRVADLKEVFKLAAQSALGNAKYHEHFVLIHDDTLPPDHVRILFGVASDGFPFKTMGIDGCTQASVSVSNLCGAANAPENQWNLIVGSVGEKDDAMLELYADLDTLFPALHQGPFEIEVIIPPNAKYHHTGKVGERHKLLVHGTFFVHFDGKTVSICWDGVGAAASQREGGMRVANLGKRGLIRPDEEIGNETSRDGLYFRTLAECARFAKEVATLRTALAGDPAIEKKIADHCAAAGHGLTKGTAPYSFMIAGFHGPLHGDMLESSIEIEASHDLALQLGLGEKFYCMLSSSNNYGLKKASSAIANRVAGKGENDTYRLAGGDAVAWGAIMRQLNSLLRVSGETAAQRFARLAVVSRVHLHRAASAIYSRHTGPLSSTERLIGMGNDVMRLLFRSGGKATYNTAHLFKSNAYMLRRLARLLKISDDEMFLIGAAAGEQGGEHLHAFFKMYFRLLTNGREGSHRAYLQARYLVQVVGESGPWPCRFDYKPNSARRFEFDDDDGFTRVEARSEQKQRKKRAAASAAAAAAPTPVVAAKPLKCAVCKEMELTAADNAHVLPESSSPAHFRCYGFFAKMCGDCYEVAAFVAEVCAGPEPTGWAKAFLQTTEGRRIAENARSGVVDEDLERRNAAEHVAAEQRRSTQASAVDSDDDVDNALGDGDGDAAGPSSSAAAARAPKKESPQERDAREASRVMFQSLGFGGGLGDLLA
jgi:hypothetical protein